MPYKPICLHKIEWDRLKSQANPPQEPRKEDDQYIKGLIEKSQEWIKSWPDTFEGQVELLQKQKKKDYAKKIANASLEEYVKQRKHDDTKQAIAKARQLIFQGSSYGKRLLSALLESKVIEEREAQIAFKKDIEKKELEIEKEKNNEELYFCKLDQDERDRVRKKKNVMFAIENKSMYETLNTKLRKDKEEEARLEREDAALMKKLLDYEKREAERVKKCQEEQVRKYDEEQQEFRKTKIKREMENDAKIEKANTEKCRLHMKMRQVQKQLFINELNKPEAKKHFKIIEEMERDKRKRFEDFVEKAVKKQEETVSKKELEDFVKRIRESEAKRLLKKQAHTAVAETDQRNNKTCDRQCLFVKSHRERLAKKQKKLICQCAEQPIPKSPDKKLRFLAPQQKLIEQLREREKEPSPWNGQSGVHAQFAQEAANTLAECKHKAMARKVVDEYRRLNCFDATTLPVQNY